MVWNFEYIFKTFFREKIKIFSYFLGNFWNFWKIKLKKSEISKNNFRFFKISEMLIKISKISKTIQKYSQQYFFDFSEIFFYLEKYLQNIFETIFLLCRSEIFPGIRKSDLENRAMILKKILMPFKKPFFPSKHLISISTESSFRYPLCSRRTVISANF